MPEQFYNGFKKRKLSRFIFCQLIGKAENSYRSDNCGALFAECPVKKPFVNRSIVSGITCSIAGERSRPGLADIMLFLVTILGAETPLSSDG